MKCIYPNGVVLTKEQTEEIQRVFAKVGEFIRNLADAFNDFIQTVAASDGFQDLLKWLRSINNTKGKTKPLKVKTPALRPMNMQMPAPPILDKRLTMHVIRSNC